MGVAILPKKISKTIKSPKKWSTKIQSDFLLQLSELLNEGFPLYDAIHFLEMTMPHQRTDFETIKDNLEAGSDFVQAITAYGFEQRTLTQLHLAIQHGDFIQTLDYCAAYIKKIEKQRRTFIKVMIYPLFLVFMAISMLFIVRRFMLPTLESLGETSNTLTKLILWYLRYLPQLFLVAAIGILLIVGAFKWYWRRNDALSKAVFIAKLPVIGRFVRLYYTFYFCKELANFLENGLSLTHMIEELKKQEYDELLAELARQMEASFFAGYSLPVFISGIPIFTTELVWMMHQGELTSQLSVKLNFYAESCFKNLITRLERMIALIQPIMFLWVGLLVVLIYLTLMLPMINLMTGVN